MTPRSLLLGLAGTCLVCGLTPYNDYALANTYLVGNNLPLGVVVLAFLFVLLVNGPLLRWRPQLALSPGELAVALSMTLVSCCLPSSGLMRYLPPAIVGPLWHAGQNGEFWLLLESLNLPHWIFPSFESDRITDWYGDPIVTDYLGRWVAAGPPPYLAWIRPVLTWGMFTAALFGALMCMVTLNRRQWDENERLPFPLAQIYVSLLEPPPAGHMLNNTFRNRSFWLAFAGVFLLHLWNGSANYFPSVVVRIPVYYDLHTLFTEPPWSYVDWKIKDAAVFFSAVGVTYFLSKSVAFSLWAFFILWQFQRMWLGTYTGDPNPQGWRDAHFGGVIAFAITVVYVGRHHWALILRQAFRGERPGEAYGRYISYPVAFWGMLACMGVMVVWLVAAGASVLASVMLVVLLVLFFFVITRIIAETGLIHGQLQVSLTRPWALAVYYGWSQPVSVETFYLGSAVNAVHYDYREVMPVYASHGIRVTDELAPMLRRTVTRSPRDERRASRGVILAMLAALVVGYFVSFGSTLWTEYNFGWTQDVSARIPLNDWGARDNPRNQILGPTLQYQQERYYLSYSPAWHFSFGFLFTLLLYGLRLWFANWPLHPIGFLMIGTYPGAHLWFSIMLGWLAKTLILRFGGSKLYLSAKPFFIGLIVGESLAAGFWLLLGIVLSQLNIPYRPVNIMPG